MRVKYLLAGAALAVLAFAILGKSPWLEGAQDPVLFRPSTRVAVVDLTKVYAEHKVFKSKAEGLRRDIAEAEEKVKSRSQEIEQALAAVKNEPAGSAKRTEVEQKLILDQQALQADVNLQKAKFMAQEARIYLEVYESVLAIIDAYAAEQKVDLVLRINDQPFDRNDMQQAMMQLNKEVIYHKGLDITDEILRRANGVLLGGGSGRLPK